MDLQDEEFLARLLATFGEEAADHIQAIVAGILVLEQDSSRSQQAEIEPVYRATHSLKGAARAVGLKDIETVCQHLESVFSSVRKGDLILTEKEFDLVHETVSLLESLLAGNKEVKITPIIQN
jgi:two-component system chemotaxis sensor kinase CheA